MTAPIFRGGIAAAPTGRAPSTGAASGVLIRSLIMMGACLATAALPARGQEVMPPPRPLELPKPLVQTAIQPRKAAEGDAPKAPEVAPPPRPALEGLPASQLPGLGATPIPSAEVRAKFSKYVRAIDDPENTLDLIIGRPRLLRLTEPPFRIQVADENVLTYNIATPPTELSLLGRTVGSTVLNLWFGDKDDPKKQTILSWVVHVLPDPEAKERLERMYKALENEINKMFCDSHVCLNLVGDKLVVSGEAKDSIEAVKILQVIRANASSGPGMGQPAAANIAGTQVSFNLANFGDTKAAPTLEDYITQGETNIINLLRIPGEQQVMLKVTVAEVSRSAARSIGLNFSIRNNNGVTVFSQNTGGLIGGGTSSNLGQSGIGGGIGGGSSTANLPVLLDNGQISLAIQALRTVNMAKSLAEPNLVTLNGQPATFLAGGEFPVPVVTGATSVGLTGVSFVPFGVQLNFIPSITDRDRIRLQLTATVSVRDVATGASFGTGGAGSTFVPGLNTRTITTTVEMREGQTLAVGGLLQTNLGGDTQRVPGIGDLPLIGHIARVDRTSASESELVLLVTPELVHPLEPHETPPLPGSDYFEPGDLEFYLLGHLENCRPSEYRSPVMHDIHRMKAYHHCELMYFSGPHGHCDGK